jgi:hypothetical protein
VAGHRTVQCVASDKAGNDAAKSVAYTVTYAMRTVTAPVAGSRHARGSTLNVRFRLRDARGALTTTATRNLARACQVTVALDATSRTACAGNASAVFTRAVRTRRSMRTGLHAVVITVYGVEHGQPVLTYVVPIRLT